MDVNSFIEQERETLGNWPKEPHDKFGNTQYFTLAKELIINVRERSISDGISLEDYSDRLMESYEVFDRLRSWLNYEENMNEEQKKDFNDQIFWLHKERYQGGLLNREQDVWPIVRPELLDDVEQYLQKSYMRSDNLDYLLTDALIYAEIASYLESLRDRYRYSEIFRTRSISFFKNLAFIMKWVTLVAALVISYSTDRSVFMLVGISIVAYQSVKAFKTKPKKDEEELYADMFALYMHCHPRHFNASVIWDMCKVVRDKGAVFDGVMYKLLEKQMKHR